MSKLVFYVDTASHLVGAQKLLIDLAAYIADNTENDVYFVNNDFSEDISRHLGTRLKCSTVDEFDYSDSNETVYFTPVNYAMHLLTKIKDYPNAKICHYVYDSQAFNWLIYHIGNRECGTSIRKLLDESNCCSYLNYKCVYPQDKYMRYGDKIFLPLSLRYPLRKVNDFFDVCVKDEINIAFYGSLNNIAANMLQNLFYNMALMDMDIPVNIHIVGDVPAIPALNFKSCTRGTSRMIFTGKLSVDDGANYIRNNADIILAYGENAVECSDFGIPVVIPVASEKSYIGNNYVYLFDVNGFVYSWNNEQLLALNNACYKIDKILFNIYNEGKKSELAAKCYNYCLKNNSLETDSDKYFKLIENSTLQVKDYLCIDEINDTLSDFENMKAGNQSLNFNLYLKNRHK